MNKCFLLVISLFVSGCATAETYPLPTDPVPQLVPNLLDAWGDAYDFAEINGGDVYRMLPTGSMEPTLIGDDYMVIVPKPWPEYVPHKIALVNVTWSFDKVIHRIVGRDSGGIITAGDANARSDPGRVTEDQVEGVLIAVWRVQK